jgi:thermostable 8-oxoguanine DNA glycosylase
MAISPCPELAPDMENRIAEKNFATKQPLFIINLLQMATLKKFKKPKQLDKNIKTKRQPLLYYKFTFKEASHYSLICIQYPMRYTIF